METAGRTSLDFKPILVAIRRHKRLYAIVLPIAFVVGCVIMLSIPAYYTCEVKLAPELTVDRTRASLNSLAVQFGLKTSTATANSSEALYPLLYPDLITSTDFKVSLFDVPVHKRGEQQQMTYYDYLKNEQKAPWWNVIIGSVTQGIMSLIPSPEDEFTTANGNKGIDPFQLTKEQTAIAQSMDSRMVCVVDENTMVITLVVSDQDPLICATIADTVQQRLQDFITKYRTQKARIDLENSLELEQEAKARYDEARKAYAAYADANQDLVMQSARSQLLNLENEMQLKYNRYNSTAQSVMSAEAKLQEETPSFTTLQRATVPVKHSGPKRVRGVLVTILLAAFGTTLWILWKEKLLKTLLGIS